MGGFPLPFQLLLDLFVQLLEDIDSEALEFIEFDPRVDTWEPPRAMENFLTRHFNMSLHGRGREGSNT